MCCHYLSDSPCQDVLLGAEECQSPFGSYELTIPVDEDVDCRPDSSQLTNKNCKDFDVSLFIIDIVLEGYLANISVLILCLPSIAKSTEQFLKSWEHYLRLKFDTQTTKTEVVRWNSHHQSGSNFPNITDYFVSQRARQRILQSDWLLVRSVFSYLYPRATITLSWVAEYIPTFVAIFPPFFHLVLPARQSVF